MRLAIVAIFKNECEYILEWIAYHRAVLGIKDFIIADNVSDDGSTQLLQALDKANIIKRIFSPRESDRIGPQIPAYNYIISQYSSEYDYFLFIDADEFLVNESGLDVSEFISNLAQLNHFGGLALNWRNFGSSGNTYKQDGLVIERFYRAAKSEEKIHHHIKSLIASKAVAKMHIHQADLLGDYCYYDETGSQVTFSNFSTGAATPENSSSPFSSNINNSIFYVAHYAVKSKAEHFSKKANRGSAGGSSSRKKGSQYFIGHDLNHEECLDLYKHRAAVSQEIQKLKQSIREHSPYYSYCHSVIDNKDEIFSGWISSDHPGTLILCCLIDNQHEIELPLNAPRDDVYRKGLSKTVLCGFNYKWSDVGEYKQSLRIWIKGGNLVIYEASNQKLNLSSMHTIIKNNIKRLLLHRN